MMHTYFIGAGHMGGALLNGLQRTFKSTESLRVIELDEQRLRYWRALGYQVSRQITEIESGSCVVLAIPPQQFEHVVALNPALANHRGPVISVMAGITHSMLVRALGHDAIVRAIPNTPAEVAQGITIFYAPKSASENLISKAVQIFDTIGISLRVSEEYQMDPCTALVGGGPAIVASFIQTLQEYGQCNGLDHIQTVDVALQLLTGTAALIRASGKPAEQICREVQTPGGTTERAINFLSAAGFKNMVNEALDAAARRSAELGQS